MVAKLKDAPRSPDYRLTCMDTDSGDKSGTLGAGWLQSGGSIRIKLSPGVSLTHGLSIVLWPADDPLPGSPGGRAPRRAPAAAKPASGFDDMDDDIPF